MNGQGDKEEVKCVIQNEKGLILGFVFSSGDGERLAGSVLVFRVTMLTYMWITQKWEHSRQLPALHRAWEKS